MKTKICGNPLCRRNEKKITKVCDISNFPIIDKKSVFYKNCKRNRKVGAKICQVCPFRKGIELQEK